jgi:RND family efflux transporter MFP subunit
MKRWMILAFSLSAGALLLVGCSSKESPVAVPAVRAETAAPASSPAPEPEFTASGPIIVENQVDVLAQRDGVVSQINSEIGQAVKKGALLGKFDDRQLIADRDAAKSRALSIQADLKNWEALTKVAQSDSARAQEMWKAQLITKEQVDHDTYKAEAAKFEVDRERENLRSAEAALQSIELELAKTRITAPFDGVVARRYVRVGQKVTKDDRLFWVTAVSPMRVKFMLPELLLNRVKRGSEITVTPAADPQHPHTAKVILMSPVVDPSSGAVEVVAELQGPAGDLRPGMTTNIRLATAK